MYYRTVQMSSEVDNKFTTLLIYEMGEAGLNSYPHYKESYSHYSKSFIHT